MDQMPNQNMPSMPVNPPTMAQPAEHVTGKKGHWTLVAIVVVLLVIFLIVMWFINQMSYSANQTAIRNNIKPNSVSQEQKLNAEVDSVNVSNPDNEFKSIDQDLNSL